MKKKEIDYTFYCGGVRCERRSTKLIHFGEHSIVTVCDRHATQFELIYQREVDELPENWRPPEGWEFIDRSRRHRGAQLPQKLRGG